MSHAALWDVRLQAQMRQGARCFSLDVAFARDAQRLVLFGPSGAGKSLTLRLMAGILTPEGGRVRVAGRVLMDQAQGVSLPPQQRRLALVFQDNALFPHLNVRQNIAFAAQRGWRNPPGTAPTARPTATSPAGTTGPHADAELEVDRWLQRFELQAVAQLMPHQISGGQQQRTALARALVSRPDALLLDEPFNSLDTALRRRLREELRELQHELQLPMLLITHDEEDVRDLAQDVVQLKEGRTV